MRALYIGPYRQNDGWGEAAKDFLKALDKSKLDVAARPIFMANNLGPQDNTFNHLEAKKFDKYDICIQQVLPTIFDPNSAFDNNVGYFFSETNHLEYTPWPSRCNLMDEIIVSSQAEANHLITSGVTKPLKKINVPVDVSKFEKYHTKVDLGEANNTFNFYFIGEYSERKNIPALLLAFHLEFDPSEQVNLVLKLNKSGIHPIQLRNKVIQDIQNLKQSFAIYENLDKYKNEILITDYMSEEELLGLHNSCNCFVMPSHGEAWCRPALDAMGFGNTPIVTDNTGMIEFINNSTGWLIKSVEAPVLCMERPLPYLYRGRETWRNINILQLRQAMREAYSNHDLKSRKFQNCIDAIYNFSYEKIAEQINDSY